MDINSLYKTISRFHSPDVGVIVGAAVAITQAEGSSAGDSKSATAACKLGGM